MSNIIKKNFKNDILFNFINSIASVDSNNEYYILTHQNIITIKQNIKAK